MDSILSSIKDSLGIGADSTDFDNEIIPLINTTFLYLGQLGVKTVGAPKITSELETWESVFGELNDLEAIKSYMYLKVKLIFDPPSSGTIIDAYKQEIASLEWRINTQVEIPNEVMTET